MVNSIGNGHSTSAVSVVKGSGVRASKQHRAALAAAILAGDVDFAPTADQLAWLLGIRTAYLDTARRLASAERRTAAVEAHTAH